MRTQVLIGSPDGFAERLREVQEELGLDGILAELNCGGRIPHDRVVNAIRLLCEEVKPRFHDIWSFRSVPSPLAGDGECGASAGAVAYSGGEVGIMRFGLFGGARTEIGEQASDSQIYTDYVDYICEAEALGFHSVFLVEHHFTGFGQISATLSFLTYLAAKTSKMRLGTAVLVLPWHNPALLAEQAATLDLLSNGRLDLGIGKGYRWGEFHGFCIPMEEAGERYEEAVAFLRKAWTTKGRFSHHGKHWHYEDIVVEPAPVQKPHPAVVDRRVQPEFDPPGGRERVQPAARPERQPRAGRREHRHLPQGGRGAGAGLRPDDGRADPGAPYRDERGGARGGAPACACSSCAMSSNCRCRRRAILRPSAARGALSRKRRCARPPKPTR